MQKLGLERSEDAPVKILQRVRRFSPKPLSVVHLDLYLMFHSRTTHKVDKKKKPVGEGLLIGLGDEPQHGFHVNGCSLMGWDIYFPGPAQSFRRTSGGVINLPQIYLKMLKKRKSCFFIRQFDKFPGFLSAPYCRLTTTLPPDTTLRWILCLCLKEKWSLADTWYPGRGKSF